MKVTRLLALALMAGAGPAFAQDSMRPDPVRAEQLRRQIEERFGERLRVELGLTDEQASRVRVALATIAARRRGMELDERRMRQALAEQLRPGIAANSDSVGKLVDALTNHRVLYAQTFRDEMRELAGILNPVQRGQYVMLRDRLMQRAQELMQGRPNQGPPPGRRPIP